MKILIVCQYFWPDNFLINEISSELVKKGNKVTVLTGLPDYTTSKIPSKYKFGRNRRENYNGVEVIRVPIIARHHGFIWRVLNYLSFFINSSIYAMFHKFDCDIIYSWQTAPVLMINPAMIIKKMTKKPLFIYVLDLWPDQMKVWNVKENNILYKIVHRYCKKAYGSGDVVGITSKPFEDYLVDVCEVDSSKIKYMPQHSARLDLNERETKSKNESINLIFAGNIGQQQNVECLLKAVSMVETKKDFKIHIYGDGTSFEDCKRLCKELKLDDKVIFYGRVSKEELNDIYPQMDAFLLTLCSEKEMGFAANTVPAKLQGYMSAGKPILASIDGGANEIIKESNCGKAVASGDYVEYAKIISDFINNPSEYKECGNNALKYFDENFEKNIVINNLINEFRKLVFDENKEKNNTKDL